MNNINDYKKIEKFFDRTQKYSPLFKWLKLFYPKFKGAHFIYSLYFFIPQKMFRINGSIPWPVHFTSRVLYYKNISIGNRSAPGMNASCYIQGRNGIKIGHNFRMGPGVGLISANHNIDDYDQWDATPPIIIGNNVWIGMNSVILPGVKIGDNVVISANSVIKTDIPSNSIASGNPGQVIKEKAPYKGKDYSKI